MSILSWLLNNSLVLLPVLVVIILCYNIAHRKIDIHKTAPPNLPSPPGPWALPIIGNLHQLGKKPHVTLLNLWRVYGNVFRVTMGSRYAVVLCGLETIWQACVKQAEDFAGRPDLYSFQFLSKGKSMGFCDYGKRWKLHRKIAQNALQTFAYKCNNPIEVTISSEADTLVRHLLKNDGKPMNPHNEIYLSVGNIICAICFGKRYQRDDPDFVKLVTLNDRFMAYAAAGNPVDIMPWTRIFMQRSLKKFLEILELMNKFCDEKQQEHLDSFNPSDLRDVTDILIKTTRELPQAEKDATGLTDEHILITVQDLIGAGFDTISSTLQWSVLYLMLHAHVQERAHEEIRRVVGMHRSTGLEDLPNLPYTEAVLIEIMRHSCIFPFAVPHSTTKDTVIKGYFVPAKTLVFINLWSLTRDPTYFPDPERFDPSRFLNDAGHLDRGKVDKFLPYGAGRRKCLGEQLAQKELFLFFSTMVQRCRFRIPKGHKPVIDSKFGLTLKPLDFETCVSARK